MVTVFAEQFSKCWDVHTSQPRYSPPGVDTGETFPYEFKETYIRMDRAILFAMTKKKKENGYRTCGRFMHCSSLAIPSGRKMNDLQLYTSMLVTCTHKLLSGENKSQKVHLLRHNFWKALKYTYSITDLLL